MIWLRFLHSVGWIALWSWALIPSPVLSQVGRTEVSEVAFQGNQSFPDDSLSRAIVTRETECRSVVFTLFCWAGADFAVQRFYLPERDVPLDRLRLEAWYYQRGFREISVDTLTSLGEEGRATVSFIIDEGEPVIATRVDFEGGEGINEDGLLEGLPLQPGERLSILALDATRDTLERRLANRGYGRVNVLRRHLIPAVEPFTALVTFDIDTGSRVRYGPIMVSGNSELSEATVLNTLQFSTGDLYSRDAVQQGQGRLFGLDIIRSASVTSDFQSDPDSVIPITVNVVEGDAYRVRYGGGWTTAECFGVEAQWAARNFVGGGRLLQIRGRVANVLTPQFQNVLCPQGGTEEFGELTGTLSLDFAQPWIFSTRNSFSTALFIERQSLPDVFIREAVGVELALTRLIGPQTSFTLSYRPELSRLDAAEVLFCTNLLVCSPEDVSILQDANWLAPIGFSFTRNLANNILNPNRGYSVVLEVEHASQWTGSNFRYDRAIAEGTLYSGLGRSGVFAARIRGGWVGAGAFEALLLTPGTFDLVHPQKRFYAGGANSVRGFAQGRLGPRVLTIDPVRLLEPGTAGAGCNPSQLMDLSCDPASIKEGRFVPRPTGGTRVLEGNLELRFPIGLNLEGVMFTDVGQVWGGRDEVDLSKLAITPGVGVRYLSPVGPIRIDLGYRFREGEPLAVVTSQLEVFNPNVHEESERIRIDGNVIPYVRTNELAALKTSRLFGEASPLSLQRFQLHISIGQAF